MDGRKFWVSGLEDFRSIFGKFEDYSEKAWKSEYGFYFPKSSLRIGKCVVFDFDFLVGKFSEAEYPKNLISTETFEKIEIASDDAIDNGKIIKWNVSRDGKSNLEPEFFGLSKETTNSEMIEYVEKGYRSFLENAENFDLMKITRTDVPAEITTGFWYEYLDSETK